MSEFFQHYPQISYNISGTKPTKLKTVINLMERAKLKGLVADDIVAYFSYSIMEGERPDHVSKKVYGNVKYTWLIFLINDISNNLYSIFLSSLNSIPYILLYSALSIKSI